MERTALSGKRPAGGQELSGVPAYRWIFAWLVSMAFYVVSSGAIYAKGSMLVPLSGDSATTPPRLIQSLAATTTTLTSSLNPVIVGQGVTFTATVTGLAPTGTVTFYEGPAVLCGAVILTGVGNSRTAQCTGVAGGMIGTHSITAEYSGDFTNAASVSPVLSQILQAASGVVTLISSLNPSTVGQNVTFTATVTGIAPTGTVTFQDNTVALCKAVALTGTGSSRTAICGTTALSVGTHNMTAVYSGDAGNAPASSAVLLHTVRTPTETILNLSPNPVRVGQTVTASVSVHAIGTSGVPTGSVTVSAGAMNCVAILWVGAGNCTLVFTTAGTHMLAARYSGDTPSMPSSATATVTIKPAATDSAAVAAPALDLRGLGLLALSIVLLVWKQYGPLRLDDSRKNLPQPNAPASQAMREG